MRDVTFQVGVIGFAGIRSEAMRQCFAGGVVLAHQLLEGTAGFPAVAGHALSTVIGCKLGLAASAVVPAGEFLVGVVHQQGVMRDGTFEEILVVRAVVPPELS